MSKTPTKVLEQQTSFAEGLMPDSCETRIREHFIHACKKHPSFANRLCSYIKLANASYNLRRVRADIVRNAKINNQDADTLLKCEIFELKEAIYKGKTDAAIEEAYDAIAVLLRIISALEGKQTLEHSDKGEGECE